MTYCDMEHVEFVRCENCGREEDCHTHYNERCECSKHECKSGKEKP